MGKTAVSGFGPRCGRRERVPSPGQEKIVRSTRPARHIVWLSEARMEIPAKIVDESLGFLRGFPRPFRMAALTCLLVPAVVFLHAHYNWPHWPLHYSPWMNRIALAFLIAA